jgi:hypothetical protein
VCLVLIFEIYIYIYKLIFNTTGMSHLKKKLLDKEGGGGGDHSDNSDIYT